MSKIKALLFDLLYRLVLSDQVTDYKETPRPEETVIEARLGPFDLGVNDCHVLESRDAWIELRAGQLQLEFSMSKGNEPIRHTGFSIRKVRFSP
jgi:hypothetical protein